MARSCVVVGGGLAGLAAAYRLATEGLHVTVLESQSHIGGRARSERVGECVVNSGASIIMSFYDATLALLRELQLQVLPARHPPGIVATPFGKLPFQIGSPQGVWRFPLIPVRRDHGPQGGGAQGRGRGSHRHHRGYPEHAAQRLRRTAAGTADPAAPALSCPVRDGSPSGRRFDVREGCPRNG
jgi:phytoene dehydrogenase-like protein